MNTKMNKVMYYCDRNNNNTFQLKLIKIFIRLNKKKKVPSNFIT